MATLSNEMSIVPSQQVSIALDRVRVLAEIVRQMRDSALKEGTDYGVIPGTGTTPTLLLPGMEKLTRALNAVPEYIERRVIVDYDKPLFHYEYECRLIDVDTGLPISGGRGLGLCTSMESAFRWRKAERTCPHCGQPAVIKGKAEYGGGWLCFARKGGCGAKWQDGDDAIEGQTVGRIENPDIFDQVNAIMKRAKKRALGDAIKGAANVSEFFTVDLEDLPRHVFSGDIVVEGEIVVDPPVAKSQPEKAVRVPAHDAWTFTDDTVTDLMFESKDWPQPSAERMNTIQAMRKEGAFDGCQTKTKALEAFKARLDTYGKKAGKVDLSAPPDDSEGGAK